MADVLPGRLGIVVGLEAEARIARRLTRPELVVVSGATAAGARRAAEALLTRDVDGLMSFGLAAGLDPRLQPGTLLMPIAVRVRGRDYRTVPVPSAAVSGAETGCLLHSDALVAGAAAKAALYRETRCVALDMESGIVAELAARHDLGCTVLRAICDPADRALPPAATEPLRPDGRVSGWRVAASIVRSPGQVPALLALGRDAARGMAALRTAVEGLVP